MGLLSGSGILERVLLAAKSGDLKKLVSQNTKPARKKYRKVGLRGLGVNVEIHTPGGKGLEVQ